MTTSAPARRDVTVSSLIGGGYDCFWRWEGRYLACKGSRGSKKSKTTAIRWIVKMMQHPGANLLVVRKVERTLRDSCFSDLVWAVRRIGVEASWRATTSPLEMSYIPTGQKILFRGLDDPQKVTSISIPHGVLCWCWVEEAYEITRESDFDMIDESIRGEVPEGLFKQVVLTFNPWNEHHWLKKRFFDHPGPDTLAMTTTYRCNEWLDDDDRRMFEEMRKRNPKRYKVAGMGEWGVVDGLVYENWREESFTLDQVRGMETFCGLDFGYTNDPSAFVIGFLDQKERRIYVWDEFYETGLSNRKICERIESMGYRKERVTADSAEPKSIQELHDMGLWIVGAKKGRDSVRSGVNWIRDHEVVVHPRCVHFLTEIGNYQWAEDRFGNKTNEPEDGFNHCMDAMRYGLERYMGGRWLA